MDSTIGTTLEELVKFIKSVSPELWRIAQRQVQVNVITDWILIMLCILLTVGCIILWFKADRSKYDSWLSDHEEGMKMLAILIGTITSTTGILLIIYIVPVMLNPEYYAIRTLMEMLSGK